MHLATDAIVLRSYHYEENRILTLLTRDRGVLTAFANYANRPRSALAATTELLCYSSFQLFQSRDSFTVDKADSNRIFFGIRSRYEDFLLASYWAQLFSELAPRGEESTPYLNLLLGCLHYLEEQSRPPLLLKAVAELRLLTLAGFMPDLIACQTCGAFAPEQPMYFSLDGSLHCQNCVGKEQEGYGALLPVSPGVLAALRHIVYAEPRRIYAFTLSDEGLRELANLTEHYLIYHLEKTLPTLDFYRSIVGDLPQ